jgi:hypothetical protein
MMGLMNFKTIAAAALISVASAGSALATTTATYYFGTYVETTSGANLGTGSQATLVVTDLGSDGVKFELTNTANDDGAYLQTKLDFLVISYLDELPDPLLYVDDTNFLRTVSTNGGSGSTEGISFDFGAVFGGKQKDFLYTGSTAIFRILNIEFGLLDFSPFNSVIHMAGFSVDNKPSTKYTTGVVPLPASLPLLLGGIGLLGFVGRRRKATPA